MAFNFSTLTVYGLGYKEVDKTQRTKLSSKEIEDIVSNKVTMDPKWGTKELECKLKSGGTVYLKLAKNSNFDIGDNVDLTKCTIIELVHEANGDIVHKLIEDELLED